MTEHYEWRMEVYQDAMDPFSPLQFYVMQGTMLLAQCDVEAHATLIISGRERLLRYQQALEQIASMPAGSPDLQRAVNLAKHALKEGGA